MIKRSRPKQRRVYIMEMMTTKQVSRAIGVSEELLRKLAREKRIPFYKLSERTLRFDLDEVRKFMRSSGSGKPFPEEQRG